MLNLEMVVEESEGFGGEKGKFHAQAHRKLQPEEVYTASLGEKIQKELSAQKMQVIPPPVEYLFLKEKKEKEKKGNEVQDRKKYPLVEEYILGES